VCVCESMLCGGGGSGDDTGHAAWKGSMHTLPSHRLAHRQAATPWPSSPRFRTMNRKGDSGEFRSSMSSMPPPAAAGLYTTCLQVGTNQPHNTHRRCIHNGVDGGGGPPSPSGNQTNVAGPAL
jgi:hypothetical protein